MYTKSRVSVLAASLLLVAVAGSAADLESAPISLSDPDGQELIIEDLSIRAAVQGMLSLTEMEFRFRNPTSRRIEGRFTCTLPPDAAISRFAKEVNGRLMEGEVVERLRANQVYEQFLHQMRDPALLEQDQGNRFSARIFPIEPNASVRIILSYTRLLPLRDGRRTFTVPLRGTAKMARFSFRATVSPLPGEESVAAASPALGPSDLTRSSVDVLTLEQRDFTPVRDIEISWRPTAGAPRNRILRAGDFYLASFRPNVSVTAAPPPSRWLFYIDTSASAAESATYRIEALRTLFAALPPTDRVEVLAFDNGVVPLRSGTAAELSRSIAEVLRGRMFLGGTDLESAIRHLARALNDQPDAAAVLVSDLVPTLGNSSAQDIAAAVRALPARARVSALVLGGRENAAAARAITAGHGRIVRIPFSEALEERSREAAASLRLPAGAAVELRDRGAEWIYPTRFEDVQPGAELIVLGRTRAGLEPAIAMAGSAETLAPWPVPSATFAPLLEREAYRAYLDFLAEREANEPSEAVRKALATEQVRISIEKRVLIPRTTMLVLESESDYQRFGIDRRADAEVVTADAGGIVASRPAPARRQAREQMKESTNQAAARPRAMEALLSPLATSVELRRGPEEKPVRADWTTPRRPSAAAIETMFASLKRDPRDRRTYNQLSDALVVTRRWEELRSLALRWQPYDPDNPQVYEVLGLATARLGHDRDAARAYASLIEVAPAKAELLQRAGLLLAGVGEARLAVAPLRRALELRPDRVNSYRHLALMLWLDRRPGEAAGVLEAATRQKFPAWYGDAQRVVREELAYVYRSWRAQSPLKAADIESRARQYGADLSRRDALRISLAWETDANDVDLHVVDPGGKECFYGNRSTPSGLELYGDVTQGLGPEVIRTATVVKGTYHIGVRYFAAGPMGISRGLVVVLREGENGEPSVTVHPFRLTEGGGEIRYVAAVEVK